jgi:isoquinoline 1-oxidoreductase beta subunit
MRIGWFWSVATIFHAFGSQRFADKRARASGKDTVEYALQLLGSDRVIPKSELRKDYSNYGGSYEQYPIDTA